MLGSKLRMTKAGSRRFSLTSWKIGQIQKIRTSGARSNISFKADGFAAA